LHSFRSTNDTTICSCKKPKNRPKSSAFKYTRNYYAYWNLLFYCNFDFFFLLNKNFYLSEATSLICLNNLIFTIHLLNKQGLVLYANFDGCDPLANSSSGVKNPNQLLPYFIIQKFNSILFVPGLFMSSIFCASLSSVSSALNRYCKQKSIFFRA
jgi:hypothetical protein